MSSLWDTAKPINHSLNSSWPEEIRNLKSLLKSRLIYQATEPAARSDSAAFEENDNGSIWIDSDNDKMYILTDYSVPTWTLAYTDMEEQFVAATHTWAASQTLGDGADLIGSATSDITMNTDKFTVAGATGNTSVGGTLESVGVATLADTSVTKTTAAPTADAQIANKKYVDDQIAAYIASEVTLSAYTSEDSETNAMLKSHTYLAATDGFVSVYGTCNTNQTIKCYVGATNNPEGAGTLIQSVEGAGGDQPMSGFFAVADGEYFEIIATSVMTILWKSIGILSKPIDQD